jgi:triacylglycerol lipase
VEPVFSTSTALNYLAIIQQIRWWNAGKAFQIPFSYRVKKPLYLYGRVFGAILESSREVLLALRGSHTLYEWTKDFQIRQVPFSTRGNSGCVHQGFYDFYLYLREQVEEEILQKPSEKRLTVIGYSLGGAIASMLSIDLASVYPDSSMRLITFASPKTGNAEFVKHLKQLVPNSIGIVNPRDRVPLQPIFPRYQQIPNLTILPRALMPYSLLPHSVEAYFSGLSQLDLNYAQTVAPFVLKEAFLK